MMESSDLKVLRDLLAWRSHGHSAVLVTVVTTWGSSPRPVGSLMALRDDGRLSGSVSGGCIEDDLVASYRSAGASAWNATTSPTLLRYGVGQDEARRFGLPCGGTIELLLECDPAVSHLQELMALLEQGQLVCRSVDCRDGTTTAQIASHPAELSFDGRLLRQTLGPDFRMLLIGAGMLAEYLATMAVFNGFSVSVCDPRVEHTASWSLAGVHGVQLLRCMPDDAVAAFRPDQRTCIVALSHDPKLDDLALLEALNSPAFYIGAIGSRRNTCARRQRLAEHFQMSAADLARLHAPVGIHIGSKTPAEIAVSVMAQIIAVKNHIRLPQDFSVSTMKTAHDLQRGLQDDTVW